MFQLDQLKFESPPPIIFKYDIVLGVYWTTYAKATSLQKSLKTEWSCCKITLDKCINC